MDGHEVAWPAPPPPLYSVPTWNGVWVGDLKDGLPEDLSTGDYAMHEYELTGDRDNPRYDFLRTLRADRT